MEEALNDPLDISKESDLIKGKSVFICFKLVILILQTRKKICQKIDVLVCGGCHEVFHFVEEFQKHKSTDQCSNISVLTCENEEKSQIWGFTLWKTKQVQTHKDKEEEPPTSWDIYQKWTKLDQIEKDLWISAGKTLQFVNKIAAGKITENDEKKIEKDPLALDDPIPNVLQK
jgi:hypothetical protein